MKLEGDSAPLGENARFVKIQWDRISTSGEIAYEQFYIINVFFDYSLKQCNETKHLCCILNLNCSLLERFAE